MLSRRQRAIRRICGGMAAACLVGGLIVSAGAPTAHALDTKPWEHLENPDSLTPGDPAAESATGGCYRDGDSIPCTVNGGLWDSSCYCYFVTWSNDPNDPDPEKKAYWDSIYWIKDGALRKCVADASGRIWYSNPFWWPTEDEPPSLEDLSDSAYLLLKGTVTAPDIGVFPGGLADTHPKASGLVGVPTWFWAENPGPGVGSPETKSTKVNGYTLEATVSFLRTEYDTGDGHTVTCGLGSVPVNVRRPKESLSGCGHTYMEPGTYTITATTYVEVSWSGAGRKGRFELVVDRTGEYRMGENQVVIVP